MKIIKNFNIEIITLVIGLNLLTIHSLRAQNHSPGMSSLVKTSEIIFVGKVESQKSFWDNSKNRIFTTVSLKVNEYLKRNNGDQNLEILVPGGEVDGVGEFYSHMPRFEEKSEVLLFVKKDRNNNLIVNQGDEGKYSLNPNEKDIGESNVKSFERFKNQINYLLRREN